MALSLSLRFNCGEVELNVLLISDKSISHLAVVLRLGDGSAGSEGLGPLDAGGGAEPGQEVALALLAADDGLLDEDALRIGLRVAVRGLLAREY